MMRVLRVCHSAVVDGWRERDRAIRARQVEVTSVSAQRWNEGGSDVTFASRPGEDAVGVATFGRHPALFVFDPRPLWKLLGEQWDVLDVHEEPFSLAVAQLRFLRWLRGCRAPYILYSAQNLDKTYPIPFRWLERSALRGAGGLQTCNAQAAKICQRKGFPGQPPVIPLGIDPGHFRPNDQPRPQSGSIGYAGRLETHKGVDVLLRAVAALDDVSLEIVGDGPAGGELRALASELGIAHRVNFQGPVAYAELPDFYRQISLLVVPSLTTESWVEQFGRVVIEAMACGTPVIASDSGALAEVVEAAGVLVPEGDAPALAAAISSTMTDLELRKSLRLKGLARAAQCDWSSVGAQFTSLYRTVTHTPVTSRSLHVVVVAYHHPQLLRDCLESITGAQVTVIDNSSDPQVRDVCLAAGVDYVDAGSNLGFGSGVNLALKRLPEDADVLLLNPDARLTNAQAQQLHHELVRDRDLGSLAASQLDQHAAPARVEWPWPSPLGAWLEAAGLGRWRRANYVIGSILVLRAEALAQVGGFNEDFFLYAEETDWARRASRMGWRHAVSAGVVGTHIGAATSTDAQRRETHFFAGQERYLRKHHGNLGWQVARAANIVGALGRASILQHRRGEFVSRARYFAHGPLRLERALSTASDTTC